MLENLYTVLADETHEIKNTVSKIPEWVIEAVKNNATPHKISYDYANEVLPSYDDLPAYFRDVLYPYQIEGIKYGIQRHGRCFIGDEMGVGKTIQAIGITMCFRHELPALIICPASIKMNWKEEICKWFKSISPSEV